MIRAILKDGVIRPVEELPPSWRDGQELVVDQPQTSRSPAEPEDVGWEQAVEEAMRNVPAEDHRRLLEAIAEHRRQANEDVRREMGLP